MSKLKCKSDPEITEFLKQIYFTVFTINENIDLDGKDDGNGRSVHC